MTDEALIEELARAIAAADGLNYDEVCKGDECDSSTCLGALDEEHDFDLSRRHYQHQARAILPIIQRERVAAGKAVKREAKEVIITGLGLTNTRMLEKMRALNVEAIVGGGE